MANFRPPVRTSPFFILPPIIPRLLSSERVSFSRFSSRRSPPPHPFTCTPRWKSRCCWAGATQSGRIQTLSDAVVVVDDEKYGKKQVISITPQLYRYILDNVREPAILKELREETAALRGSQMQVSPDQAQLLAMLVQILGAQRCIEVGIYTVAVKHALAVDSLESMIKEGEAGSYDFAFVDADKRLYHKYYELILELVRPGGVIVIDNVLWHGKVADPAVNDPKTTAIRDFNKFVYNDKRVSISVVPIGDGMSVCRKL